MKMKLILGLTATCLMTGTIAFASPVTPAYDTFGTLSGATFGGTGIPNNAVAITTINNGNDTITLGLTATPRYSAPAVSNDGDGTFFATPGASSGKSLWNFDYYISVNNSGFGNYSFELLYGTDASSLTTMSPDPASVAYFDGGSAFTTVGDVITAQDSENLGFSFLGSAIGFDPNANGIYSFELEAFDGNGNQIGNTAINVDVGTVPAVTSTAMLLMFGFTGLMLFGYRQNRLQLARMAK
jgi:hypothetical protein